MSSLAKHQLNTPNGLSPKTHLRYDPQLSDNSKIGCCCCGRDYPLSHYIEPRFFEYSGSSCCGGAPICNSCLYDVTFKREKRCIWCDSQIFPETRPCYDAQNDWYPLHQAAAVFTDTLAAAQSGGKPMGGQMRSFQELASLYSIMQLIDRCVIMSFEMSRKIYLKQTRIPRPFQYHFFHPASIRDHPWLTNNVLFSDLVFLAKIRERNIKFNLSRRVIREFLWYGGSLPLLSEERRQTPMMNRVLEIFQVKSINDFYRAHHKSLPGLRTCPEGAYNALRKERKCNFAALF